MVKKRQKMIKEDSWPDTERKKEINKQTKRYFLNSKEKKKI